MATLSRYCKAYYVSQLQQYDEWQAYAARVPGLATEKKASGDEQTHETDQVDEEYLFLHDNYVVTAGVFLDENIVFDRVTDEWISFCHDTLKFEIPPQVTGQDSIEQA